jgi:hypothetical protein
MSLVMAVSPEESGWDACATSVYSTGKATSRTRTRQGAAARQALDSSDQKFARDKLRNSPWNLTVPDSISGGRSIAFCDRSLPKLQAASALQHDSRAMRR